MDVVGHTLAELTEELTIRYAGERINPELSVSVQEFATLTVHGGRGECAGCRETVYRSV